MDLFREGLLAGRRFALSGGAAAVLTEPLERLGAEAEALEAGDEEAAEAWARASAPLHGLVHDAGPGLRAHGLQPALEGAWVAVRAVVTGALIPSRAGGKVILICPRPGDGEHAEAAAAGLENLARTLSVEWARYGITAVAISPGPGRDDEDGLAAVVAFAASRAGDYLSGCRLELCALARAS